MEESIVIEKSWRSLFKSCVIFLTSDGIGLGNIFARSTEYPNPVPFVLVCYVVVNPHELLSVFWYKDVSLTSVTSDILKC